MAQEKCKKCTPETLSECDCRDLSVKQEHSKAVEDGALEKWIPRAPNNGYRDGFIVDQELLFGAGGLQKVTYMFLLGPGGPIFIVLVVMLVLHWRGALNGLYFVGLIALGMVGAIALTYRGKSDGS